MQLTALPFSQYRHVRWRNGGGNARDIAVYPAETDISSQLGWRVALAEIERDGPFSLYEPDIERVITLLDGAGLDLDFAEAPGIALSERHMPARFRGHWRTDCRLRNGRCIVLNILHDDRAFTAQAHTVRPIANQPMTLSPPGRHSIVFCLSGHFEIEAEAMPDDTATAELGSWDSLRIDLGSDDSPLLSLTATMAESRLLLIGFDPVDFDPAETTTNTNPTVYSTLARTT